MDPWDPNNQSVFEAIRKSRLEDVRAAVSAVIPQHLMPPADFIQLLTPGNQAEVYKACLIVFLISGSQIVPRKLQLLAALATLAGNDSEVISGTGTGKTLAMAIPHLLHPERVSLIVSPLKRLEVTQVCIFTVIMHVRV